MKLKLERTMCGMKSTIGQLSIDGRHFAMTCEDVDRMLEDGDGSGKVKGQTCIPRGTYVIKLTMSNRFKRILPLLLDVPFFTGVRIHPGNTNEDTEGCLLVGSGVSMFGDAKGVTNSATTFKLLFATLEVAATRGEEITIGVT